MDVSSPTLSCIFSNIPGVKPLSLEPVFKVCNMSALLGPIGAADLNGVDAFFRTQGSLVNAPYSPVGHTPLMRAVESGHLKIVQLFVQAYYENGGFIVDLNRATSDGATALMYAVAGRLTSIVRVLLEARGVYGPRVNVNACTVQRVNALMIAARLGYYEGVQMLMEAGANLNAAAEGGCTPLMCAVYSRRIQVVKLFVEALDSQGHFLTHLTACTEVGETALSIAIQEKFEEAVLLLMRTQDAQGRRINLYGSYQGRSLVHFAALHGCTAVVDELKVFRRPVAEAPPVIEREEETKHDKAPVPDVPQVPVVIETAKISRKLINLALPRAKKRPRKKQKPLPGIHPALLDAIQA